MIKFWTRNILLFCLLLIVNECYANDELVIVIKNDVFGSVGDDVEVEAEVLYDDGHYVGGPIEEGDWQWWCNDEEMNFDWQDDGDYDSSGYFYSYYPGLYTVQVYAEDAQDDDQTSTNVYVIDVSITSIGQSPSWLSSPCYHLDFQGVSASTPGFYDLDISGSIAPAWLSYKWTISGTGSLSNDTTATPTIDNPTSGEYTLTLKAMLGEIDTGIHLTREVKIYQDHLARDIDNFLNGKACSPNIQLPDGSYVTGSLSCSSAATHALDGTTGSGTYLRNYSWSNVTADVPYNTFKTMSLQRGWVLELKYVSGGNLYFLHWQTVKEAGTGATAITYAADAGTHIFRHETVDDYYDEHSISESNRKIKIYKP